MRLPLFASLISTALACIPDYDPEYYRGFLPPVACWQDQDSWCRPYIHPDTELLVYPDQHFAVVVGITQLCIDTIVEELTREQDGRKTYGWREEHGKLGVIRDTLVITEMSDEAVQRYLQLDYWDGW